MAATQGEPTRRPAGKWHLADPQVAVSTAPWVSDREVSTEQLGRGGASASRTQAWGGTAAWGRCKVSPLPLERRKG